MKIECQITEECFDPHSNAFYKGTRDIIFRRLGDHVMIKNPDEQILYLRFGELQKAVEALKYIESVKT